MALSERSIDCSCACSMNHMEECMKYLLPEELHGRYKLIFSSDGSGKGAAVVAAVAKDAAPEVRVRHPHAHPTPKHAQQDSK